MRLLEFIDIDLIAKRRSGKRQAPPPSLIRIGMLLSTLFLLAACSTPNQNESIEFQFVRNVPIVAATIGESDDLHFLVDTGVDPSVIDLLAARQLGLPVDETEVGEASGAGDGSGLAIMRSSIRDLSIAGRKFASIDALAANLSAFSAALEMELTGILGFSFLDRQIVRIDYRSNQIAFSNTAQNLPALSTPIASTYRTSLRFNSDEDPIPVFDIAIAGEMVTVSLDTGKSAGIEFFKPVTDRLNLQARSGRVGEASRLGARGRQTVSTGVLAAVELGPFVIVDVPASFSKKVPGNEVREGNAGNAFLKNFVVTIDYANGEILFEK